MEDDEFADPRLTAPWPEQAWAMVVVFAVLGVVALATTLLLGAAELLVARYRCGRNSCGGDTAPQLWQLVALVGCVAVGGVSGRRVRRLRAARHRAPTEHA